MTAILISTFGQIHERNFDGALQISEAIKKSMQGDVLVLGLIDSPDLATQFIDSANENKNVIGLIQARFHESPFSNLAYLAPENKSIHPRKIRFVAARERPMTNDEWQRSLDWTVYLAQVGEYHLNKNLQPKNRSNL